MYDPDGLDGLDELAFLKKFRRRMKRIRRRVKRIVKKVVKVPFKLAKKVVRVPLRLTKKVVRKVNPFKSKRRRSTTTNARQKAAAARRASNLRRARRVMTSKATFKTAIPRGNFSTILPAVKPPPKETSALTEPALSPLTRKVGASPLSKSVVVNLSTPRSGGGGGNMYRPMNTPRPSGVNLKTAAMIGIPAVLGLGAVIMMTTRKR